MPCSPRTLAAAACTIMRAQTRSCWPGRMATHSISRPIADFPGPAPAMSDIPMDGRIFRGTAACAGPMERRLTAMSRSWASWPQWRAFWRWGSPTASRARGHWLARVFAKGSARCGAPSSRIGMRGRPIWPSQMHPIAFDARPTFPRWS